MHTKIQQCEFTEEAVPVLQNYTFSKIFEKKIFHFFVKSEIFRILYETISILYSLEWSSLPLFQNLCFTSLAKESAEKRELLYVPSSLAYCSRSSIFKGA